MQRKMKFTLTAGFKAELGIHHPANWFSVHQQRTASENKEACLAESNLRGNPWGIERRKGRVSESEDRRLKARTCLLA